MTEINVTVTNSEADTISVSNVTDGSEVTVASSSTPSVSLTVGAGSGPLGTDVALAAGTGISIAQANNTATISSTVTSVENLTDLTDVTNTTPTSGQVLAYNGTAWEATTQSTGSGSSNLTLTDVAPEALGTGAVGSSTDAARADHVHNMPTFHEVTNGTATTSSNLTLDAATGVVIVQGGTEGSAALTLNCEQNSHGVTIAGPPHSAGATYTLTLPTSTGSAGQTLTTDGSGSLSWSSPSAAAAGVQWVTAPESSTSAGTAGQLAYDSERFLYFHTGTEWVRAQFASFTTDVTVSIITQPADQSVAPYANPSFAVIAAASDLNGVSYQWQQSTDSGTTWADISSQTAASFSLSGVTSGDSGKQFRVVVTSTSTASATATSQAAVLTVGEFDYILEEAGNILTDESGNRLTHEGATSAPSGGGSSSQYESLIDISTRDQTISELNFYPSTTSSYTFTANPTVSVEVLQPGAEYGASKIFLNYDGSQIFAAHSSDAYYLSDSNQDYSLPELRYEKHRNEFAPVQAAFLSGTNNNVKRAWFPRSISKASNANVIAGLHAHKDGSDPKNVRLEVIKGDDALFETKTLISENFDYLAETGSAFYTNGPGSWFDKEYMTYNTAVSSNGQFVIVCIPYVSTTTAGAAGFENGIVKVFAIGTNAITQVGSDIQPFTSTGFTGNTGWQIGALACRISDNGTAIAFTGGPYGSEVLHRYDLVNSTTWTARATLTPSSNYRKSWSIAKDCNRVAVGDSSSNNRTELYDYTASSDTWASSATINALSNTDEFGSAVSLNDAGDVLAVGARSSNDPSDTSNTKHGAFVMYELNSGSGTWEQLTDVVYGHDDDARMGSMIAVSGDGMRVLVQSETNNGVHAGQGGCQLYYRQQTPTPNYTPGKTGLSDFFYNLDLSNNHPSIKVFDTLVAKYMRAPSGFTTYKWQYKHDESAAWSDNWGGGFATTSDELMLDRRSGSSAGSTISRISAYWVNDQYRCLMDEGLSTEAVTQTARYVMYRGNHHPYEISSASITATQPGNGYVSMNISDKFDWIRRVWSVSVYLQMQYYYGANWASYSIDGVTDSNGRLFASVSDPVTSRKNETYNLSSISSSTITQYRFRVAIAYVDGITIDSNGVDHTHSTTTENFYSNSFTL